MTYLYELSAVDITKKIAAKEILVSEVASIFINRIKEVNPIINALQQFDEDRILKEALELDKIQNKSNLGQLHGLPVSIKDAFHVKDFICSKGSLGLYGSPSTHDATVVARIKKEGGHVYGITNTSELLLNYESDNLLYGRTNNPFDLKRTAGGSSGGSAAIIAVGGTPVSIGNDAGGSLRQPAHYCGICAHKPTHGLVPTTGNYPVDGFGIASSLIAIGPMSRYVEDLILMMKIISGPDKQDPHASSTSFIHRQSDLKDLKIAYFYTNPAGTLPSSETIQAIDIAVSLLKARGCVVTEHYPQVLNKVYSLHYETFMLGGDGGLGLSNLISRFKNKAISPLTESFLEKAKELNLSVAELRQRFSELENFLFQMMAFMEKFDLIISPVTTTPARLHGETVANIEDVGYITAHNLTGWPSTVIPCTYSKCGLPIGIQIVGKKWQDHLTLNTALYLQNILGVFPIPKVTNNQTK